MCLLGSFHGGQGVRNPPPPPWKITYKLWDGPPREAIQNIAMTLPGGIFWICTCLKAAETLHQDQWQFNCHPDRYKVATIHLVAFNADRNINHYQAHILSQRITLFVETITTGPWLKMYDMKLSFIIINM